MVKRTHVEVLFSFSVEGEVPSAWAAALEAIGGESEYRTLLDARIVLEEDEDA